MDPARTIIGELGHPDPELGEQNLANKGHSAQVDRSSLTSLGSILPAIEPDGAKPQSSAPIRL